MWLIFISKGLLSMMAQSRMESTSQFCCMAIRRDKLQTLNIFNMQQKLIITLWKAQFKEPNPHDSLYCRITYNQAQRNSKLTTRDKNMTWKQTFILPLSKQNAPLHLDFIPLQEGEAIHFAKDQVAESLSFGRATMMIDVQSPNRGSLPCKLDILDKDKQNIGKIFIEFEMMKTEVTYTVEKQLDYVYLLKLTNFRVNFVRRIKNKPKFYLHFHLDNRIHKEILPFEQQEPGIFTYNYPVKLYVKKQIQAEIILYVKDEDYIEGDNQTESQYSESLFSQKKTFKSSVGKKDKLWLDISKEKVAAIFDLTFKRDVKVNRKIALTTIIKYQKRDIGHIQFQAQSFFRSKEELQQLQEQKKGVGLNPQKQAKTVEKKKSLVKQSNGIIIINSILGKLELFNQALIQNKNMSVQLKLGQQQKESTVLERPGKQIIFIDTFTFKRTWEQTIKLTINIHNQQRQKLPTFFAQLNLRELFEMGRLSSKKIKLKDQNRNYSGELILDLQYKEIEEKRSPSIKEQMEPIEEYPQDQALVQEIKAMKKKEQIVERMKARKEVKQKSKQLNSMSTLAVLQSNDILLPPLKSISRMTTLSPKRERTKGAQVFNQNGAIRFSKSPRFQNPDYKQGYESYTYVRQSDFDSRRRKGASMGYGDKHDFTKDYYKAPGVGRYQIQSVWDKYK